MADAARLMCIVGASFAVAGCALRGGGVRDSPEISRCIRAHSVAKFDALILEIDYEQGRKPGTDALERIEQWAATYWPGSRITLELGAAIPSRHFGQLSSWPEVVKKFATPTDNTGYAYVLYSPWLGFGSGALAFTALPCDRAAGLSHPVIVIGRRLRSPWRPRADPAVESAVLLHELGHILGLRIDGKGGHCSVRSCLMNWRTGGRTQLARWFPIPRRWVRTDLCTGCADQLRKSSSAGSQR